MKIILPKFFDFSGLKHGGQYMVNDMFKWLTTHKSNPFRFLINRIFKQSNEDFKKNNKSNGENEKRPNKYIKINQYIQDHENDLNVNKTRFPYTATCLYKKIKSDENAKSTPGHSCNNQKKFIRCPSINNRNTRFFTHRRANLGNMVAEYNRTNYVPSPSFMIGNK